MSTKVLICKKTEDARDTTDTSFCKYREHAKILIVFKWWCNCLILCEDYFPIRDSKRLECEKSAFKKRTLHEKCPNSELFLVRIFLYLDWIRTRNNSVSGHFSRSDWAVVCKQLFIGWYNFVKSSMRNWPKWLKSDISARNFRCKLRTNVNNICENFHQYFCCLLFLYDLW